MIINGDCIEELKKMEANSVDTIITDPPYGLSFMGKKWDYDVPSVEMWKEALRVLKPGGTALIFAGSRTQHRMAVNVEDAGFQLFDTILWLYGQGFPKSHNIEKALLKKCSCGNMEVYESKQNTKHGVRPLSDTNISESINPKDKQGEILQSELSEQSPHKTMLRKESQKGSLREKERVLERRGNSKKSKGELQGGDISEVSERVSGDGEKGRLYNATQVSNGSISEQVTDENGSSTSRRPQSEQQQDREPCAFCKQHRPQEIRTWSGWGTSLKPSYEPIICARKKNEGTYANNALKWGVSGLNIDGGRIGLAEGEDTKRVKGGHKTSYIGGEMEKNFDIEHQNDRDKGRFPANIILDEIAGELLDEQSGILTTGAMGKKDADYVMKSGGCFGVGNVTKPNKIASKGGASRFFYCAKASKSERNKGCEGLEEKVGAKQFNEGMEGKVRSNGTIIKKAPIQSNNHPTVKPLKLMEYLCTLTKTPTGGVVLDPFAGSGTTGVACKNTGRDFILIEREAEYIPIIEARLSAVEDTLF